MLNAQQTLEGGFERAMPIISAYWATRIANANQAPIPIEAIKILDENPDYKANRDYNRRFRDKILTTLSHA